MRSNKSSEPSARLILPKVPSSTGPTSTPSRSRKAATTPRKIPSFQHRVRRSTPITMRRATHDSTPAAWARFPSRSRAREWHASEIAAKHSYVTPERTIIQLLGTMNYDHGQYSVSISPSVGASDETRTFNASSLWFAYDRCVMRRRAILISTDLGYQHSVLRIWSRQRPNLPNYYEKPGSGLVHGPSSGEFPLTDA